MGDMCNQTAYEVMNTLRGPNPPTYVASFGNTPITSVGDWVGIIDNPPPVSYNFIHTCSVCNIYSV